MSFSLSVTVKNKSEAISACEGNGLPPSVKAVLDAMINRFTEQPRINVEHHEPMGDVKAPLAPAHEVVPNPVKIAIYAVGHINDDGGGELQIRVSRDDDKARSPAATASRTVGQPITDPE